MSTLAFVFIGSPIDLAIIIIYFLAIVGFGSFFGTFTKTSKDFFLAGQRFPWWLITVSCVATLVGSYSFIKYSEMGYCYGLSSSMSYLNDWFIMPFFLFGWLPIIYFSKVLSIPEYFEKRFHSTSRLLATIFIMVYLIGYISINFLTLGICLNQLVGIDIPTAVILTAVFTAIYVTAGGQTAVIMTDLVQGVILLVAGFVLFGFGIAYVGGFGAFWDKLPTSHRLPFSGFAEPAAFAGVGIFWQDAIANSLAFYFMNQGMIMRFLSAKSIQESRKAIIVMILVLMPLVAISVSNMGWIGSALPKEEIVKMEQQMAQSAGNPSAPLPTQPTSKNIFITVARIISLPGVFGLMIAALIAALMSTVDTLINAASAIFVNDIWKRYVRKDAPDKHYLTMARWFSIFVAILGVSLVPIFAAQKSLYNAHGMFTAAITPPMVVAILLGAFWKKFSTKAVNTTIILGTFAIGLSFVYSKVIFTWEIFGYKIFSWGVGPEGYDFMRAFFGLSVCLCIGIFTGIIFRAPTIDSIQGYVFGTILPSNTRSPETSKKCAPISGILAIVSIPDSEVRLSKRAIEQLGCRVGDNVYVGDTRWWLGGIRSGHFQIGSCHEHDGIIQINQTSLENNNLLLERHVQVERT